jgi:uncharacterized protein YdeI (YjbR/CyaY-like superfamily)
MNILKKLLKLKNLLKIHYTPITERDYPIESVERLEKSPDFKKAFESLTPGCKNRYILHFTTPKQSATRISRIEKYREKTLNCKGINDL